MPDPGWRRGGGGMGGSAPCLYSSYNAGVSRKYEEPIDFRDF